MVNRNWTRSPLKPGVAHEMLEDENDEDQTFCLGERVELAVTMENKAKVSRCGEHPDLGVGAVSPLWPCHAFHLHIPQGKRIVSEKPARARNQGSDQPLGAGQGQSPSTQIATSSDSSRKVHFQEGTVS